MTAPLLVVHGVMTGVVAPRHDMSIVTTAAERPIFYIAVTIFGWHSDDCPLGGLPLLPFRP